MATKIIAPSGGDATSFAGLFAVPYTMTAGDRIEVRASAPGGIVTLDERAVLNGSGTGGSPILIFPRYGDTVKIRGFNFNSKDYVRIFGFEVTHGHATNYAYPGFYLSGCVGCWVHNCYIHDLGNDQDGVEFASNSGCTDNVVSFNNLDLNPQSGATSLGRGVNLFGDRNLVEYNQYATGQDRHRVHGADNVIRNNYSAPMNQSDIPGTDPHIDEIQTFSDASVFNRNLYECNFSETNRSGNAHMFIIQDASVVGIRHIIARHNSMSKIGAHIGEAVDCPDQYFYNNTFVDALDYITKQDFCVYCHGTATTSTSKWWNNIFVRCTNNNAAPAIVGGELCTVTQDYNHGYLSGQFSGANSVTGSSPLFQDETGLDFRLQSGSPCKATGKAIWTTSGAGTNSVTLVITGDAKALFDGWSWLTGEGDYISINGGAWTRITAISGNTLTLETARTWTDGQTIRLKGTADKGSMPYDLAASVVQVTNTTSATLNAGSVNLTATSSTPEAVRKVLFRVDGVYAGQALYSAAGTYSVAWTSDGLPHVVEAVACHWWASRTRFISEAISVNAPGGVAPSTAGRSRVAQRQPRMSLHRVR